MRANHVPVQDRLRNRIRKLEVRRDYNHIPSPNKGNPYWCCRRCGIHDPSRSINKGRHHHGCPLQGIDKEIEYYRSLLEQSGPTPPPRQFPSRRMWSFSEPYG